MVDIMVDISDILRVRRILSRRLIFCLLMSWFQRLSDPRSPDFYVANFCIDGSTLQSAFINDTEDSWKVYKITPGRENLLIFQPCLDSQNPIALKENNEFSIYPNCDCNMTVSVEPVLKLDYTGLFGFIISLNEKEIASCNFPLTKEDNKSLSNGCQFEEPQFEVSLYNGSYYFNYKTVIIRRTYIGIKKQSVLRSTDIVNLSLMTFHESYLKFKTTEVVFECKNCK